MSNGNLNDDMILDDFDVDFDDMEPVEQEIPIQTTTVQTQKPEVKPSKNVNANNIVKPTLKKDNVQRPQNNQQMTEAELQMAYERDIDTNTPDNYQPADTQGNKTKAKKEKAPKQPKVKKEKAPKQPKVKKEKENKVNQHEGSSDFNKKSWVVTLGIVVGAIVGVIVLGLVLLKVLGGDGKHITLADEAPPIIEETVENTIVTEKIEDTETVEGVEQTAKKPVKRDEPFEQTSTATILNVGSDIIIPVTVNTKLEGDEQYYDYYSYIALKINDITVGYDNVITHVQKHNQVSTNKLNIDDKETLLANNQNSDLVMYSVSVFVPEDFPSQDGKVYINPDLSLRIEGTDEIDSIITDKYVFAVPQLFDISGEPEFSINETTELKWVGIVPYNLDRSTYSIKLTYSADGEESVYTINGIEIPEQVASEEVTETEAESVETEAVETEAESVETEAENE